MRHVAQFHRNRWINHASMTVRHGSDEFPSPRLDRKQRCNALRNETIDSRSPILRAASHCRLARRRALIRASSMRPKFWPRRARHCRIKHGVIDSRRIHRFQSFLWIVNRHRARRPNAADFPFGPASPRRNRRRQLKQSHDRRRPTARRRLEFFATWGMRSPHFDRESRLSPDFGMFPGHAHRR